jgi:endosialidase-like protein
MGSQSQGSGTSTTTMPQSTFGNILGGLLGGTGLLSNMGAFGPSGWLLSSDERVKDDVEEVGKMHDGQSIYRFRYKGDPTMRIGLLAQEVAEHEPDAVHKLPIGILAVDHKLATDRAVRMGREV